MNDYANKGFLSGEEKGGVWEKRFTRLVNLIMATVAVCVFIGALVYFDDVAKIVAEVIEAPSVLTLSADD